MCLEDWYYISQIIMPVGLIATVIMLILQRKTFKDDHDLRRREQALNALLKFTELSNTGLLFVSKKMLGFLTKEEKKAIMDASKDVKIDKKNLVYIKSIICKDHCICNENCDDCKIFKIKNGKIRIKRENVISIRQSIITYFNTIEFLTMAAIKNVADEDMLAEQFEYIVKDTEYIYLLEQCGVKDGYPCTIQFIEKFKGRNTDTSKTKTG
ncbi:MAG: hypothetical protein LBV20_06565 [Treponema sp.]|jgi:hypothetical protein|nr:hypothetical protein [Treponema sp.]